MQSSATDAESGSRTGKPLLFPQISQNMSLGPDIIILLDDTIIGLAVPIICFSELAAVMWGYGFKNFASDMDFMLGIKFRPTQCWFAFFVVFLPISILVLAVLHWSFVPSTLVQWQRSFCDAFYLLTVVTPIAVWFILHARSIYISMRGRKRCSKFTTKLFRRSWRWLPNDGTNIHRDADTIFADVIPSLAHHRTKSFSTSDNCEASFVFVNRQILTFPKDEYIRASTSLVLPEIVREDLAAKAKEDLAVTVPKSDVADSTVLVASNDSIV